MSGAVVVPVDYRASGDLVAAIQGVAEAKLLLRGDEPGPVDLPIPACSPRHGPEILVPTEADPIMGDKSPKAKQRGEKQKDVAVIFAVSKSSISRIVRRAGWTHV